MSTKKEKCRCCDGECNHDACCGKIEENCATNCPCHQSESIEWEKFAEKVSENFDSIYRKFPANEAAVIIRNRIKNSFPSLISQAITTAVAKDRELGNPYNSVSTWKEIGKNRGYWDFFKDQVIYAREKEIADKVEKMKTSPLPFAHPDCESNSEHNRTIEKVLQILKH